jgi:hypothetical protein
MASGHVNRANRPNTWLHRPALQREEKPCQQGAVHTWHSCYEQSRRSGVWFGLLRGPLSFADHFGGGPKSDLGRLQDSTEFRGADGSRRPVPGVPRPL